MTKADDIKAIREFGREWIEVSEQMRPQDSVALGAAALKILGTVCLNVSSLMAGEGEKEQGAPTTGHPIHPPSYDEGWNAAIDEIMSMTGLPTGQEHKDRTAAEVETLLAAFGRRITALRKPPRSNPND